jgi:hypothetical protein
LRYHGAGEGDEELKDVGMHWKKAEQYHGNEKFKSGKISKEIHPCSGRSHFFNVARIALKFCNTRWLDF